VFHHEPREFIKEGDSVRKVKVEDLQTGEMKSMECDGVFIFAGTMPNLELFDEELDLDQWGYVRTDQGMRTNIPDVFAVGDIRSKQFRQITTAVSDGTIAAMSAARELEMAAV
jgi:thioredoxin reductase (NADPH)